MTNDFPSLTRKVASPEALKTALLEALKKRTAPPLYAAIDGALFDDLPSLLRGSGLSYRSLYLGGDTSEIVAAGPWLVVCADFEEVERLLALAGESALPVFWELEPVGAADQLDAQAAIYRHLRTLNKIVIPKKPEDQKPPQAAPEENAPVEAGVGPNERLVTFRHYEPNALALIVAVLDEPQIARLLGPARAIYVASFDMDDIHLVARVPEQPDAPHGFLRLTQGQIEGIEEKRREISRGRITAYLREVAPNECRAYNERELVEFVKKSELGANAFGIRSEYSRGLWAYMLITSKGDFSQDPAIQRLMKLNHPSTPDQRAEMLFDARLNAMKGAL